MKLECLQRLAQKTQCEKVITEWMVSERLITKDDENAIFVNKGENLIIHEIHILLGTLLATEKVQLVDYMWNILPVEQIRITLVSDNEKREFTYGI